MERACTIACVLLAGLLLTGCHKGDQEQKAPDSKPSATGVSSNAVPNGSIVVNGDQASDPDLVSRDLGTLNLTNHAETCVLLGQGKDCVVTPNVIDSHNVQLTLTVESKKANGKVHDMSITQVVAKSGKPFEVAVGEFNFSLTPNVTSE